MKNPPMSAADECASVRTATELGLWPCPHCNAVWRNACAGQPCARCGTRLFRRKPQSLALAWAFLIAACILYLPANLLPVMITRTLFGAQQDTIMGGVMLFWVSGSYVLAAVIFIASFLVPLFKLAALFLLLVTTQRRSRWRRGERATLYHIVEFVGRWSMLDVFVVSLLTGLVQIRGLAQITAGLGIAAFGGVVVLTMLASLCFDPRLIWDEDRSQATPTPNHSNPSET